MHVYSSMVGARITVQIGLAKVTCESENVITLTTLAHRIFGGTKHLCDAAACSTRKFPKPEVHHLQSTHVAFCAQQQRTSVQVQVIQEYCDAGTYDQEQLLAKYSIQIFQKICPDLGLA